MKQMKPIGKFLKKFMFDHGIAAKVLTKKLGYAKSYLPSLKYGHIKPSKEFIYRFENSFDLTDNEKQELDNIVTNNMMEYLTDDDPETREKKYLKDIFDSKLKILTKSQIITIRFILNNPEFARNIKSKTIDLM